MSKHRFIPLEEAKTLIIDAITNFDPELGKRATSILYNNERLNIAIEEKPKTQMMACRPAGVTLEDVKAADMYIPDYKERFGPRFTQQDNPKPFSIIDFEYVGTPNSIIYLGHELGHAIADDIQIENGRSFRDFSGKELEEQAYFIQHIVSRHLRENMSEHDTSPVALGEDISSMSDDRAEQFITAQGAFQKATDQETPIERQQTILYALDQRTLEI